jgi:hypothetical protein
MFSGIILVRIFGAFLVVLVSLFAQIIISGYERMIEKPSRGRDGRFTGERDLYFCLKDKREIPASGLLGWIFLTVFINLIAWL